MAPSTSFIVAAHLNHLVPVEIQLMSVKILHYLTGILGVSLNGLLLYFSLFKSPKKIDKYRVLIVNAAFTDMCASFFTMLVEERTVAFHHALAQISYGVCRYMNQTFCFVFQGLVLHFFIHSMWSILLSFIYRYLILVRESPSVRNIVLAIVVFYIPSLVQLITFMFTMGNPEDLLQLLHDYCPEYGGITIDLLSGITNTSSPAAILVLLTMTGPVIPMYVGILKLRHGIIKKLEQAQQHLSAETKKLHRQLLQALTYQAMLPALFLFSILLFYLQLTIIFTCPATECLIYAIPALIPVFAAIISLTHIKPYKVAFQNMFCLSSGEKPIVIEYSSSQSSHSASTIVSNNSHSSRKISAKTVPMFVN